MRIVILGGPGAGKGTQAKLLCHKLSIPWLSIGDILRQDIQEGTALGLEALPYLEKGELVPDIIIIEFIRQRLLEDDVNDGWVLDGYPRTAFQAEELDFLLAELNQNLDHVIWLDVPQDIMIKRTMERSRIDDDPDIIQTRMNVFTQVTIPMMEYYQRQNRLTSINGNQSIPDVQQEIYQKFNIFWRK